MAGTLSLSSLSLTNALSKGVSGPLGPLTASFPEASIAGATVFDVTGLKGAEKVIMLSPADGRLAISSTGKRIVAGLVPSNTGTINVALATSKGRLLNVTVTVSALTPLNAGSASVAPFGVFSLRRVIPSYAGNCIQVRDSGNTLRTIGFNADNSMNTTGLSGYGDGVTFTVAGWYDQSTGGMGNIGTTARPRLVFPNAPTDYLGAYIDFGTKGTYIAGGNVTAGGTANLAVFTICNTLGHASGAAGLAARPGTFSSSVSAPVISLQNGGEVVYAAGDPKRVEGADSSAATCMYNLRETVLDTTALVGSGTARYRNFWFNQRGAVVDGGIDSRIAFTDRRHGVGSFTGTMQVGISANRSVNFNGTVQEVIIFNGASPLPTSEALRIAKEQRTYWTGTTASNYVAANDSYQAAVYGTISDGLWALASDGIHPPIQKATQGLTYHVATIPAVSPPYAVTKMRWAFSNWATINDGSEPPEQDTGNDIVVRAALWVGGAFVQNLTFNGASEVTLTSGTDVFCDTVSVNWAGSTNYEIRTSCKFNGSRPCSYNGTGIIGQDCASEAQMLGLLSSGTIVNNLYGTGIYAYGPSLAISDGWDGRACPLLVGDSIGFGDYSARSWITIGLSSTIAGQALPYANMCVQGTRPANSYEITAGLFRRKDQLLRAAIAINGGHPLWTAIISEHGVNDAGAVGATAGGVLSTRVSYFLKFAWYRYRPDKLVQTTYTPRVQPGADLWLYSYPATSASTTSDPTTDRWITSDYIKTTPWPLTGYIDVRAAWTGSSTGTTWRDCAGTGTLTSSVSIGVNQFYANAAPDIGDGAVLDAGVSGSVESLGQVQTVTGTGPYLITTSSPSVKAHASGAVVRYSTSYDGVHPARTSKGYTLAATEVANLKVAGGLDKAA